MYSDWKRGKRSEYKEHRRKLQSLKAERTKHGSPLTQTPASMKYLVQGNAALYINLLLIGRLRSHTHTSDLCVWHTQDLITFLQLKMCPSVSTLSLICLWFTDSRDHMNCNMNNGNELIVLFISFTYTHLDVIFTCWTWMNTIKYTIA